MIDQFDMRVAMSRLTVGQLATYLRVKGWKQVSCRYENRILFLGEEHSEGERYELYLPAAPDEAKYRTLLQRAIYKLCGVEERELHEIFFDLYEILECGEQAEEPVAAPRGGQRVRLRNSGSAPLRVQIVSRRGELELLPTEAIEVSLDSAADDITEIDHQGSLLIIRDRP